VRSAIELVRQAVHDGLVTAAHDVSDGGLACALAECAIAGEVGASVDLDPLVELRGCSGEAALFGEGVGGFLVAGTRDRVEALERQGAASGVDVLPIGTAGGDRLTLSAAEAEVSVSLAEAAGAWRSLAGRMG
jgi:phosphoribosylformylglycinamidine synthase